METEQDNKLAVLDVLVTETHPEDLKRRSTDQILNYGSNHPRCHKESCMRTLFKRIETYCNTTEAKHTEEKRLYHTFQDNVYPRNFIRRCLRRQHRTDDPRTNENRRVSIPYIKNIAEMTARLLQQYGLSVTYKPINTLRQKLSRTKPNCNPMNKTNVIYQVSCRDCGKQYVGQTGRRLSTRIHEHQLAVRRHDLSSLISIHEDAEGHQFNLDEVKILARANTRRKREFMEAWHSTLNSINRHIDIEPIYEPLRSRELQVHPRPPMNQRSRD